MSDFFVFTTRVAKPARNTGIQEYPGRLPQLFTEHKNNTLNGLKLNTSDRVLSWILLLEEYAVTFEHGLFILSLLRMSNDKKGAQDIWLDTTQYSRFLPLGHHLYGSGGSIYNQYIIQNTFSVCTHNDRSRNLQKACSKFSKSQISQQHPPKDFFKTSGWHITHDLILSSLTIGTFGKLKSEFKQICDNYGFKFN
jgi:hypothetical protein